MNRRPLSPPPAPVPLPLLLDRALVGGLAALVAARPLAAGDDPGRLRLTDGGGPVSFNLCALLLLAAWAVWRLAFARTRPAGWAWAPVLIAGIGVAAFASARLGDRYARPGVFAAGEWVALAAAVFLTRRVAAAPADSRGLLNVFLASAVSVAGLGAYQFLTEPLGLPRLDVTVPGEPTGLAGDDEFYPELNRPPAPGGPARGTFDSPETLLVFLLLALPAAVVTARAAWPARRGRWVAAVPVVIAAGMGAALLSKPFADPGGWSAAVDLAGGHPLLGVGPGNFSRFAAPVPSPGGAWFGLAATVGLVGVGLFAAAVAVLLWNARSAGDTEETDGPPSGTRWEFHLGGAAGLVLGFVWAFGEVPAEAPAREVFVLGAQAVVRSALWFAAFALLETARPSRRALGRAALAGAGLVLLAGFASEAPGRPTVLFPTVVLLAVAANLLRPRAELPDGPWSRPVRAVGVLLAAGLAVGDLVVVCLPAWGTAAAVRQARMASRHFADRAREVDRANPGPARANALTAARNYLLGNVINPLHDAAVRDPGNAALWLEVARWRRPLWEYQLAADPRDAARVADETRKAAELAGQLDPHNPAAQRNLFEALLLYRGKSAVRQPERVAALNKLIGQIAEREPAAEVPLRYRVVRGLLDRGDAEGLEPEVVTLLRLNREPGQPHGALTPEQKDDVVQRAMRRLPTPPPELLQEWTN